MKLFVLRDTEVIHYEMLEIIIVKESIEEVNNYLNKFAEEYLKTVEEFEYSDYEKINEVCVKYNLFFGYSIEKHYILDDFEQYISRFSNLKVIVESETNLPEGVVCSLSVGG